MRNNTLFLTICAIPVRLLLACAILSLTACGGGGGNDASTPASTSSPTTPTTPTTTTTSPSTSVNNVASITVDQGPAAVTSQNIAEANLMYTTVKVCVPGTQTCATVDHVMVDTGSSGLRLFASALPASFSLPQRTDSNNHALAECIQFVDGYSWGPLQSADLQIAGETASSLPIQVIGSSSFSTVPTTCSNTGTSLNTVQDFGANGILGISNSAQDCGTDCTLTNLNGSAENNVYYSCTSTQSCTATALPLSAQVPNPITLFASDNNGSVITLPAIPSSGEAAVSGSLIFGIGTQSNNALGKAVALQVDSDLFEFRTSYAGVNYDESYIDSGTNFYGVPNPNNNIEVCSNDSNQAGYGFFCPSSTLNTSATLIGINGASQTEGFSIANALTLFSNPTYSAFNDLGGPSESGSSRSTQTFAWGSPFFYGKTVFTAIEGTTTPSSTQTPYVAF